MKSYVITFENKDGHNQDGVDRIELIDFPSIYNKIDATTISLNTFVRLLYEDGWNGIFDKDSMDKQNKYSQFRLYSKKYNALLIIKVSDDIEYKHSVAVSINEGIINLNKMTGNNDINNFRKNNVYFNLIKKFLKSIKGIKYNPSIRKLLKTKEGKIVLCTAAGIIAVFGSLLTWTASEYAKTQEVIDNMPKSSYQTRTSPDNGNLDIDRAEQNGEVDTSLANPNKYYEDVKKKYNQENYQNVR